MLELDRIYNEDCLEGLKKIADKSIDLIVTDPPYEFVASGNNYGGRGALGSKGRAYHAELENAGLISGFQREEIMRECIRVMKKLNIYIWCSKEQIRWYLNFFEGYSMELLTWHKLNPIPTCCNKYLSDTEYLLLFRAKGAYLGGTFETKRKYFLQNTNTADKDLWNHPTIKPLNIIQTLVINSSQEGDIVLDPFMGSGTTAIACIKEKRHYLGFEISKEYFDKACQRIEIENSTLSLF
jgi:DNA modification methylase